jgi:hypothetical protein
MRLWSIHPKYLDSKGLVTLWREGLLAKKVLGNKTKGYKNHPQLIRFKNFKNPLLAINSYLFFVYLESKTRGYNFNINKLDIDKLIFQVLPVSKGQINYEFNHLLKKVKQRDRNFYKKLINKKQKILPHPLFYKVKGGIEKWEKVK